MAGSKKKYTLFSTASVETGAKPPCAFFASAAGCRNGDKCKFAHVLPGAAPVPAPAAPAGNYVSLLDHKSASSMAVAKSRQSLDVSSVVSSESSAGGGDYRGAAQKAPEEKPDVNQVGPKKKKARRGKRKKSQESPFPNSKPGNSTSVGNTIKSEAGVPSPPHSNNTQNINSGANNQSTNHDRASEPQKTLASGAKRTKKENPSSASAGFRSLNLPVASFTMPGSLNKNVSQSDSASSENPRVENDMAGAVTPHIQNEDSSLPLPKSTETGRQFLLAVQNTQKSPRFKEWYDFEKMKDMDMRAGHPSNAWVKTKPFGSWCRDNPQVIAIDCEMCETQDPVTEIRNSRALCRVSIVDAATGDVLLDTLVKPSWPVTDHRSWCNGITADDLANVQFTIRHAQAFMMALCSEETVIVGHAVYNDLAAMQIEHHCVADSACLFSALDSPAATVSLRDLASNVFQQDMPEKHDSVNDARTALACVQHYLDKGGVVDGIKRSSKSRPNYGSQLFVHRIPSKCTEEHLSQMFLGNTSVEPSEVEPIQNPNGQGKTIVHFRTARHADLAFDTLEGKTEIESSGRLQKKVYMRDGGYIRIRKMAFEKSDSSDPDMTNPHNDRKRKSM